MTFDLLVWPVDRALTLEEAVAEIGRLGAGSRFGIGHDKRLDAFIAVMERRYPALRGRGPVPPPFEFDVHRRHVFLGIPWSLAEAVAADVADAAWNTGLAIFDPQREAVGLPAPFADAPLTAEGVEPHVRAADEALAAIEQAAALPAEDEAEVRLAISGELAAAGFHQMSPLGFEITPEVADEAFADPLRLPSSLQTPDRKATLIVEVAGAAIGPRHKALVQLAGWDPDPDVAAALRPVLESEDVFEAGQAAQGLARQRDITDLPAVLNLVHRMSPADGGTVEAMLIPLRAALDLAALGGAVATDGVKARARTWRGKPRVRYQSWERELDRELESLLGDA